MPEDKIIIERLSPSSKISYEVIDKICKMLLIGASVEIASSAGGISGSTFSTWMKKAETAAPSSIFTHFRNKVNKALAQAEVRDIARVDMAGENDWRAAAWKLERRTSDRWAKKETQQLEVSGRDGNPIEIHQKKAVLISGIKTYLKEIEESSDDEEFE